MTRISLATIVLASLCTAVLGAEESASAVSSQSDVQVEAGCEKNVKVMSQADLDAIRTCKIFKGTIDIDHIAATQLRMEGVEQLIGDLVMNGNVDLEKFSAPELQKVEGAVKIENHTILNKMEFPKLTEAKTFSMAVVPALEVISFPAGLTKVNNMRIEDTRAPKVDGFRPETIESFTLLSNNYMKSFDFNSVKEVTGEMLILGNNKLMTFEANQLVALKMATFLNLAQIDMPALTNVQSDLSFHDNELTVLNLDRVELIGGTMTIANNNKLTETSFKNLTRIDGALSIGNNTQLTSIDGFPKLAEIHGTVDLAGGFNKYNLPVLQDVRGGMRLQTTSSQLGCSDIERKLKGENIVKGNAWSCTASMQESNMVPTVGQKPSVANKAGGGSSGGSSNGNGSDSMQSSGMRLGANGGWIAMAMAVVYSLV
ncbi:3-ketoacyl-CoA thiolase with broad chain length specificity [Mucor velutinosus]|uniref:3-ketoacyl-CoA thiolase with broad chain length specificity n=1 Tax=Mucor velutinosus TaxID=708070 RepID=A0AAN7DHK1_9FUNG|nr:3-ketoacyl-CoA thiolase with broad chain length specificity [Mucor velutinosus]